MRGPASIRITRASLESISRKSRASVKRLISPIAPASSTPVGPPPTITKREQRLLALGIGSVLGILEGGQHAAADLGRLLEGLEPGRVFLPLVVAEVRVLGAAGEDEIVVAQLAEVGGERRAARSTASTSLCSTRTLREAREDAADRRRDLRRAEARHRHLVEQRLEQMVVAAVDQRHLDAAHAAEPLGGVQPGEAAADDHDLACAAQGATITLPQVWREPSASSAAGDLLERVGPEDHRLDLALAVETEERAERLADARRLVHARARPSAGRRSRCS